LEIIQAVIQKEKAMKHTKSIASKGCLVILISVLFAGALFGGDPRWANREAVTKDLGNLALRAQDYYRRPFSKGGGQGSFTGLSADASGLAKLTSNGITKNGFYSIITAGYATSVELRGIGTQLGNDGSWINITMLVFADSTALRYNN
jgi:hypothetical protein